MRHLARHLGRHFAATLAAACALAVLPLGAGLLLLLPGKTADAVTVRESGFPFSLEAEEKRI